MFDRDLSAPSQSGNNESCHLSAFLNQGMVDISKKRKEIEAMTMGGRKTTLVDTLSLSLQGTSVAKNYELYRYESTGGTEKYKDGNAYGYIQDKNHYLEVQVVCDTFTMLDSATDALKAIRYNDTVSKNDLF